jgi:hypothetical protein
VLAGLSVPPAFASITSPSPVDTSNAIRWDPDGSPIGDIVFEFISEDDDTKKIDAPFPINFYGTRFPSICMSTNGLVYPIPQVSANCSAEFDRNLSTLSVASEAGAIAALALDLDLGERIHNPQRESTEELEVASVTVLGSIITVTTKAPHGFRVGELVRFEQSTQYIDNGGVPSSLSERRVSSMPTSTTFTVENTQNYTNGTSTPMDGRRAVVFREVVFERVTKLELSGTTLTVTTSSDSDFGVGGKFTFTGTGIPGLDGQKFVLNSLVGSKIFTVTVPGSVADVDSTQAGNQTVREFTNSSTRPWALERDEVGAIQQVYFGTTSVDGRDAYSLTWYRTGTNDTDTNGINGGFFPAINPETLSITVQLLIVKRSTGSDAVGWDFDYEVNIGHATDASDGYSAADPTSTCDTGNLSNCRWGIGTAQYLSGASIASISRDGTALTVNTSGAHNFVAGQRMVFQAVTGSRTISKGTWNVLAVVDSDTFTIQDGRAAFSEEPVQSGQIFYSQASELFPSNNVLELRDAGGSTALVRNSLNSNVLGRYTFGMINGVVTNFLAPTMGQGVSGAAPAAPAPAAPAPAAPAPAAPAPAAPAPAASTSPSAVLAATGPETNNLLSASIWMMVVGGLIVLLSRRRTQDD